MSSDSYKSGFAVQSIEEAFPDVPLPIDPFGGRVLVQVRRLPSKSKSGIVLIEHTKDTAKWNTQTAKLMAVGPLAFRNRETSEPWPEGVWATVGEYVRIPRWDGDRIEVFLPDDPDPVIFVTLNDAQILGRVRGDPLNTLVYQL